MIGGIDCYYTNHYKRYYDQSTGRLLSAERDNPARLLFSNLAHGFCDKVSQWPNQILEQGTLAGRNQHVGWHARL
jgi:hypothetical protein